MLGISECFWRMVVKVCGRGRYSAGRSWQPQRWQWIWEYSVIRQDHGALDHVLQFAHVAGPSIGLECCHGVRGNIIDLLAHPPAEDIDELLNQCRDIFAAGAKWRQQDGKHVQSVVEVAAKFALSYHCRQIAVRRGHSPNVHVMGTAAS